MLRQANAELASVFTFFSLSKKYLLDTLSDYLVKNAKAKVYLPNVKILGHVTANKLFF